MGFDWLEALGVRVDNIDRTTPRRDLETLIDFVERGWPMTEQVARLVCHVPRFAVAIYLRDNGHGRAYQVVTPKGVLNPTTPKNATTYLRNAGFAKEARATLDALNAIKVLEADEVLT